MIAIKALTLLCLALGANAGLCKPSSSDISTTATSATSTSTTSSIPCPAYTVISPQPPGQLCNVAVSRGSSGSSPYFLSFPPSTSLEGCAKLCADKATCVSFYVEMYSPAPGVFFPICELFSALKKDIEFGAPPGGAYYDQACFACDRD